MNNEKVQNIDSNTACVNASEQQHPAWYNLKYAAVGIIFGIVFVRQKLFLGLESKRCLDYKAFICLV